jgi:hypothetical protein
MTKSTEIVNVAEPETLGIHTALLLAALEFAEKGGDRDYLNGVYIHTYEGDLHVVASDGHRMFVGKRELVDNPSWLKDGLLISLDGLKPRLKLIDSGSPVTNVTFARGAGTVELADTNGNDRFRLAATQELAFPDYMTVIGQATDDMRREFEPVGMNSKYIGDVQRLAKLLDPLCTIEGTKANGMVVRMYQNDPTTPAFFTFDGVDGVMLVQMPVRVADQIGAGTAKLLDPAVKGRVAALRAHVTRNEAQLEGLKDGDKAEVEAKIADLKRRISELTDPKVQVEDKSTAETEGQADAGDKFEDSSEAEADTGSPDPAPQPEPTAEPEGETKADDKAADKTEAKTEAKPTRGRRGRKAKTTETTEEPTAKKAA